MQCLKAIGSLAFSLAASVALGTMIPAPCSAAVCFLFVFYFKRKPRPQKSLCQVGVKTADQPREASDPRYFDGNKQPYVDTKANP